MASSYNDCLTQCEMPILNTDIADDHAGANAVICSVTSLFQCLSSDEFSQ